MTRLATSAELRLAYLVAHTPGGVSAAFVRRDADINAAAEGLIHALRSFRNVRTIEFQQIFQAKKINCIFRDGKNGLLVIGTTSAPVWSEISLDTAFFAYPMSAMEKIPALKHISATIEVVSGQLMPELE